MSKSGNIFNLISAAILTVVLMGTVSCFDLWTEQHPGTYYTFNGQTVADYLDQDETGRFSDFLRGMA